MDQSPYVAIACGGTGGHLFPGLAVAEQLTRRGCTACLLISPKAVDQTAVLSARDVEVKTLPAIALQRGSRLRFFISLQQAFRSALRLFRERCPDVVLAMGGFTSVGPVMAARRLGVPVCLHESNTIPGRANRLLSRFADEVFVGFSSASSRLGSNNIHVTGTPVRERLHPVEAAGCRQALGFRPEDPVVLVVGGSQGASGVNHLVSASLPEVCARHPRTQWLHLAGPNDQQALKQAYSRLKVAFRVHDFFDRMDIALGAASVAVSRAGASALAELAAVQVPAILVPYPHAAHNHQLQNARALEASGAAVVLEERGATPERLAGLLKRLLGSEVELEMMRQCLAGWHRRNAAREIVDRMLQRVESSNRSARRPGNQPNPVRHGESMVA